jgi:hypothetical protein
LLQNALDGKLKQAQDWLSDPDGLVGSAGKCNKLDVNVWFWMKTSHVWLADHFTVSYDSMWTVSCCGPDLNGFTPNLLSTIRESIE